MAANTIDQAFIRQFETEVHMAYQRMGSKLRNTVRTTNVTGSSARFQRIGAGSASTKSRNGMVTPMELAHTFVEANVADFYAAEYIDKLDELKININERQAVAQSAAAALGRKTDEIIVTALDAGASATQVNSAGAALDKADMLQTFELFGMADIPEDGQRYIAMHPKGFADLFNINEFASSDYVGPQNLPFAGGMTMKEFLGFKIFSTSAVPAGKNFAYHTSSIGLAINSDVQTEINYVAEKVSHLATSMMSMGAIAIDANGIYELLDNN
jgi:predicted RNase H-related nuclease YkuK (DUF458 family)